MKEEVNTRLKRLPSIKINTISILVILLAGLLIFFSTQSPYFLTTLNITNVLVQVTTIGLIAIPMTYVIISGAMDLSVGSILGLSAVTLGFLYESGTNIWVSVVLALVVGALAGALNGLLIARYKMQAIVVTIGTLVMLRGLVYIITKGKPISGYPDSFYFLGQGKVLGIPFSVIVMMALFSIAYILIKKTRIGRYTYALGNNEEAVRYSGINVVKVRFLTFVMSGLFAGIAAIFYVSRYASAQASAGDGIELDVITAVLIGGTHIFGGRGSLVGTFLGVLIIGTLRNGLNLMGVSVLFQTVILGVLILVAVSRQNK
ncbi:ABC transporter permease [Aquibacillus koreensis]|uniref:Autoinducer 2 import system permease protein LsrD n=1 Tax=Aquibacillus koreensis TaxID=279446 RepID=A0A9X3WJD0_9BACI|nr:ABC transporter permease [Aquibacillus koreensis]MCT2534735.1 ABC transporter permease [Aquibacillus koreensis]MDC3419655.1 ABC transporter permease [Aquibacillus koreensis]